MRATSRPQLAVLAALASAMLATSPSADVPEPGTSATRRLAVAGSEAWKPLTFPRRDRHTRYVQQLDGKTGEPVLHAHSECSASALLLRVEDVDLRATPRLRWRWKIAQGLDNPDERSREGDDFAARVYALFDFEPEHASWWQRVQRRAGQTLYGAAMPGMAITYVWASRAAPGESWPNPYQSDAHTQVLRSGEPSGWRDESVDLVADFERHFGRPAPALLGVAVMSDSDDTCQSAAARFADFRLEGPERDAAAAKTAPPR